MEDDRQCVEQRIDHQTWTRRVRDRLIALAEHYNARAGVPVILEDGSSAELAAIYEVPVQVIYAARSRLSRAASNDLILYRLWREM
jgi:hypothetical protein